MNDRMSRLEELLTAALKCAESERLGYLKAQCGADSSLFSDLLERLNRAEPESKSDYSTQAPAEPLNPVAMDRPEQLRKDQVHPAGGAPSPSLRRPSMAASEVAPSTIDRFQVLQKLGKGGFGSVYHAFDLRIKRNVAIKILDREGAELCELLSEARAQGQLEHEGIIRIYDVFEEAKLSSNDGALASVPCIVMEYVDGGTLSIAIRSRQLTHQQSVEIVMSIADSMSYAHRKGIVHRDLKPQNILLDRQGRPKVADFGIALHGDDANRPKGFGTLAYMSPEQMRSEPLDARADIWSLGVIFYEMLTGRRPFHGSMKEMAAQIGSQDPPRPRHLSDSIPPTLESICLHCLQRHKHQRLSSMSELLELLETWDRPKPSAEIALAEVELDTVPVLGSASTHQAITSLSDLVPWSELSEIHRGAIQKLLMHLAKADIARLSAAIRNPGVGLQSCLLLRSVREFSRQAIQIKMDISADNLATIRHDFVKCLAALRDNRVYDYYASILRPAVVDLTRLLVSVARTKSVTEDIHFAAREFAGDTKDDVLFRRLLDL